MACAITGTIEEQRDLHNATVKFKRSLAKDIKKDSPNKTELDVNDTIALVLEENNIPKLLNEKTKGHVLYRINTANNSETSVDVYAINEFKGGYKILYTTPGTNTAKVVRVASTGRTHNAKYDMDNLVATYKKLNKSKPIVKEEKAGSEYHQEIMEFNAYGDDTKIEINPANTEIINAALINDMSNSEDILEKIIEIDGTKISESHKELLTNTLRGLTDMNKKIIPDMIQTINKDASKNYGKMIMKGKEKGVYLGISSGAQTAGNAMSASEMYVHELLHAALEYAQRDKREIIAHTMNDIEHIYSVFLDTITEEDFMPALGSNQSIDRKAERKNAKRRIAQLRDPKKGINEFIVMSQTSEIVNKVLEERVIVGKVNKKGKTMFQKLVALIQNLYESLYIVVRGDSKNLDGSSAMIKYIQEISAVNNKSISEINHRNALLTAFNKGMDFMNTKGSTYIKAGLKKLSKTVGTKSGDKFEADLIDFIKNKDTYGPIKKAYFLSKMMSKWLTDTSEHSVGSFETWLELMGLEPEGTIQQLIRGLRNSDDQETLVENLGLMTNKVEHNVEMAIAQQANLIKALFGLEPDQAMNEQDSIALTKGILDIDLDSLIGENLDFTQTKQIENLKKMLKDEKAIEEEMAIVKDQIKISIKDKKEATTAINQSIGLGKYMITGNAGYEQLVNSHMIYGLATNNMSMHSINTRNEGKDGAYNRMLIDKLATLQALLSTDQQVKTRLSTILNENKNAILGIMNYNKNAKNQLKSLDENKYNLHYVKGKHEKINSGFITHKVFLKSGKERMNEQNYIPSEGLTFNDEYDLYLNSDFTEPGHEAEGMRMTNDGHKINSYLNIIKENLIEDYDKIYEQKEIVKTRNFVKAKLDEKNLEVVTEFKKMQNENYVPSNTGMRPIFAVGKNGELFVTDMDISVDKSLLEDGLRTNNNVATVLGKTYSRAIDIKESKKNNMKILDAAQKDMFENYDDSKDYFQGGSKNLMSYVKIGPRENNKINKEIWKVLPRYMKVEIVKRQYANKKQQISKLAKRIGIHEESKIVTDNIVKLLDKLEIERNKAIENIDDILTIEKDIASKLKDNLKKYVDKLEDSNEKADIEEEMKKIDDSDPYIAVRRNLVYHYFGNEEPSLLHYGKKKNINKLITIAKYIDMIWKHISKIIKVNIVIRDVSVLAMNIVSNIILAVLQGRNPITSVKQQVSGIINLHKYREDSRQAVQLKIKISSGNYTTADKNKLNKHVASMNKNPVKPLIDAGLYTSATEDLSNEELHRETYLDGLIDKQTAKLPKGMKDTIDALFITKQSPLFHGLLLAMQYSDFGARYDTYYKLLAEGWSPPKAIKKVLDNQINYGFKHGKILQWLNARIILMFTTFFEKIQRVLKETAIDKPFNVLLAVLSGGFMFDDGPLGDSVLSRNLGGMVTYPWEIPGMLLETPSLVEPLFEGHF